MSAKTRFELGGEFEDKNFASCFARSVVVNSQYKQAKSLDGTKQESINAGELQLKKSSTPDTADGIRLRRVSIRLQGADFMLNRHLDRPGVPTILFFAAVYETTKNTFHSTYLLHSILKTCKNIRCNLNRLKNIKPLLKFNIIDLV